MRIFLKPAIAVFIVFLFFTRADGQDSTRVNNAVDSLEISREYFWNHLPQPIGYTNDFERLFSPGQVDSFNKIIDSFEKVTTIHIYIITLDSSCVEADKFEELALRFANQWGADQKVLDNGVVICISANHRKMRICNGYGIAGQLTDIETKKTIDNDFIPSFRGGNYYLGTLNGLYSLMKKLNTDPPKN